MAFAAVREGGGQKTHARFAKFAKGEGKKGGRRWRYERCSGREGRGKKIGGKGGFWIAGEGEKVDINLYGQRFSFRQNVGCGCGGGCGVWTRFLGGGVRYDGVDLGIEGKGGFESGRGLRGNIVFRVRTGAGGGSEPGGERGRKRGTECGGGGGAFGFDGVGGGAGRRGVGFDDFDGRGRELPGGGGGRGGVEAHGRQQAVRGGGPGGGIRAVRGRGERSDHGVRDGRDSDGDPPRDERAGGVRVGGRRGRQRVGGDARGALDFTGQRALRAGRDAARVVRYADGEGLRRQRGDHMVGRERRAPPASAAVPRETRT